MDQEQNVEPKEEGLVESQAGDTEEAAMIAAIAEARGEEPPAGSDNPHEQSTDEKPATLAGLTEDQVKDLMAKVSKVDALETQLRTVHGRYGELNSKFQQLQQAGQQKEAQAATETQDADVRALTKQYHEAVLDGDMDTAGDLLVKLQGSRNTPPQVDFEGRIGQALSAQDLKLEARLLAMRHPDWATVSKTNDFASWEQTLPETDRTQLDTSNDAVYLAEKLDEFKEWRKQQASAIPPSQNQQQKNDRLERAMTPTGSSAAPQPAVTEEDAMRAAVRARLRPRMPAN